MIAQVKSVGCAAIGKLSTPVLGAVATTDIQHDFYYNISASPTSVGSKTQFGLWWQTEYL